MIGEYVTAVSDAGLRVGLYYSPLRWRYPGYYDVTGTNCLSNTWGYVTDPAHKENARIMKNEVYQQVRELVTQYGKIDDLWWDGGWLGQTGTDADAAFFWEPGKFRAASNEWTGPSDAGTVRLVNRKSGTVLDVRDASTADGGAVVQWPWSGGANQQGRLLPDADGTYRLSNARSGKALQSPGNSVQGDGLTQWSDDDGDNRAWKLVPSRTSGYHQLVDVRNGWCADVKDAATADGAPVIKWPATGGSHQDWRILPCSPRVTRR